MSTASQKAEFTQRTLMALLTEQADLARIPGHTFVASEKNEVQKDWILLAPQLKKRLGCSFEA
jgi:hypothetical protein